MCYSYETSLQSHNYNDEIEFLCFRGGLGSFCKAGVILNRFRKPPGWSPRQSQPPDCIRGVCHLPFSDPDVSFAGTWPRSWHPCIVLTTPFSLWFKMSPATPPSYVNLFTSWRQSKYYQPLFVKVAERSVLFRSLSSYKNTKHVALLAFL